MLTCWKNLAFSGPGPGLAQRLGKKKKISISEKTWGRRIVAATAAAKSLQSCQTLCDPIDGSGR